MTINFLGISFRVAAVLACACTLLNFGPVRVGAKWPFSSTTGLYLALAMALSLGCWSFVLSEFYRAETRRSLSQTFETLYMAEEARVGIVRIAGWLRRASETRELEPAFGHQIASVINNIDRLLTLEQLNQKQIDLLLRARNVIKAQVIPMPLIGRGYDEALRHTDEIEQNLAKIAHLARLMHGDELSAA
jgi:hypothetical protein